MILYSLRGRLLPGRDRGGGRGASSEFAALRYVALNGTDHRSRHEQNTAIAAYVLWHNAQAGPKANFVPDSPIRTWTEYPAKVA